ncbi:YfcC family protein [Aliikangiella marina]|uniref:YfcC family protein n=1 Tax=Aliikangiella marina TaxID=1712262 RepID=A0A545T6I9_9GAMM|nr:TIGR00366 family protein [Aliikangiella marina]TQV72836.1 YfcC family protein [Aliikangiella marina]
MSSIKVPHTLVLLFGMVLLAYLATFLVPAGTFEMATKDGHQVVIPGTYQQLENVDPLPLWSVFTVIPRALGEAQGIIFFLFLIGGALAVIRSTGAIDAILGKVLDKFSHRPAMLLFMVMLSFMAGSASIGMAEEYIPLVLILITICVSLKMDTVAAVATMVVGYGMGYGVAAINPFTVLVAQGVAGVELASGWEYRLALFVPFMAVGFHHLWGYSSKVLENPQNSLVYDVAEAQPPTVEGHPELNARRKIVLWATLITLVGIVWGIAKYGWYFKELGAIFLGLTLVVVFVSGITLDDAAKKFIEGASELTGTAILIGFARSIELILSDAQVLHTIVNALSQPLTYAGAELAAVGMLLIQSVLNFFIPSGSGQAYVTMPLMAPIADIVGVSRQVAVLAYQMGDGLMNMIVPTNPVLMGILGMCGIPYSRWLKFIGPLILKLLSLSAVSLVVAVLINYQ